MRSSYFVFTLFSATAGLAAYQYRQNRTGADTGITETVGRDAATLSAHVRTATSKEWAKCFEAYNSFISEHPIEPRNPFDYEDQKLDSTPTVELKAQMLQLLSRAVAEENTREVSELEGAKSPTIAAIQLLQSSIHEYRFNLSPVAFKTVLADALSGPSLSNDEQLEAPRLALLLLSIGQRYDKFAASSQTSDVFLDAASLELIIKALSADNAIEKAGIAAVTFAKIMAESQLKERIQVESSDVSERK